MRSAGLAWSGHGAVNVVEVSADGGRSWQRLRKSNLSQGLYRPTRFRLALALAWATCGFAKPRRGQCRAIAQPTRSGALADAAPGFTYHYNGIQSWGVDQQGRVSNVYR